MFYLIPAPLHRLILRIAHNLRKRWWQVRKPFIRGARVVALNDEDQVLLIRHSYGSGRWMLPGGGVRRSEDGVPAAMRELLEETACILEAAVEIDVSKVRLHGANNKVHIVVGRTSSEPKPDGREVIETRFFAVDRLPIGMPGYMGRGLRKWVTAYKDHNRDS